MRDDTTAGNRGFDQAVQLLVSSDGQLQVTGSDTLHLQVLGRVAGQLEHLGGGGEEKGKLLVNKRKNFPPADLVQIPALFNSAEYGF